MIFFLFITPETLFMANCLKIVCCFLHGPLDTQYVLYIHVLRELQQLNCLAQLKLLLFFLFCRDIPGALSRFLFSNHPQNVNLLKLLFLFCLNSMDFLPEFCVPTMIEQCRVFILFPTRINENGKLIIRSRRSNVITNHLMICFASNHKKAREQSEFLQPLD